MIHGHGRARAGRSRVSSATTPSTQNSNRRRKAAYVSARSVSDVFPGSCVSAGNGPTTGDVRDNGCCDQQLLGTGANLCSAIACVASRWIAPLPGQTVVSFNGSEFCSYRPCSVGEKVTVKPGSGSDQDPEPEPEPEPVAQPQQQPVSEPLSLAQPLPLDVDALHGQPQP
eukprot:tig00021035_g17266.t1